MSGSVEFNYRKAAGKHPYPRWPFYAWEWTNTVTGGIIGWELLAHADEENDLWVDAETAGWVSGVPPRTVELRGWARVCGITKAWPWTPVKRHDKEVWIYLPELVKCCDRVIGAHAINYLNVKRSVFSDNMVVRHKTVRKGPAPFRGKSSVGYFLEDVVEMSGKIKLKRVFGKAYPYSRMDALFDYSPEFIARIEMLEGYSHGK